MEEYKQLELLQTNGSGFSQLNVNEDNLLRTPLVGKVEMN